MTQDELNRKLLETIRRGGTVEAVAALLEDGANPNAKDGDESALYLAFTPWDIEESVRQGIIRALVGAGADINAADAMGQTALHMAVYDANLANVKLLLSLGANPDGNPDCSGKDFKDCECLTPLQAAVSGTHGSSPAIARALLKGGANPNVRTKDDRTILDLCSTDCARIKPLLQQAMQDGPRPAKAPAKRKVSPCGKGPVPTP